MRLLVVEDQKDLNEIIVRKLKRESYSVDSCLDGNEALDYLAVTDYDGIILDIMLPGVTGLGILRKLRQSGDLTPVLLLTALGAVEDRIAGLDAGADDYMVKPFDLDELAARVRAITRRSGGRADTVITCGDLSLDTATREVRRGSKEVQLTAKEYAILQYLMQNAGRPVSRETILDHIWNYDYDGASNMVDVYVHHLRKKIDKGFDEKKIQTIHGVGYILK